MLLPLLPLLPTTGFAQDRDVVERVRDFLGQERALQGRAGELASEWRVSDRFENSRLGVTHVYLQQQYRGIDIFNAVDCYVVDRAGQVSRMGERWHRPLPRGAARAGLELNADQAIRSAAEYQGLPVPPVLGEVPVAPEYLALPNGELRLTWTVGLRVPGHYWHVHVDALNGSVLRARDLVRRDSYRVYALPAESPASGPRSLEVNPADATASPFGWHDLDGIAGADSTLSEGNATVAQEDVDADDAAGFQPEGGPALAFDFPLDASLQPFANQSAGITNLLYWNNILHDLHYQYGFDEASGNFQIDNYGKGGLAADPVFADALDGGDLDNAAFFTPPDGSPGLMEMYEWRSGELFLTAPPSLFGIYAAGTGTFGPVVTTPATVSGNVVLVDDGVVENTDACSALTSASATAVSGNIALVDRGNCLFIEKAAAVQAAGAIGMIVVNAPGPEGEFIVTMNPFDPAITIPALFVGFSNGALIKAQLPSPGVTAALEGLIRDGSLDNSLIIHEYGHGVSIRLTGGASNVLCLDALQSDGMGEGWSDWWALALTTKPGDRRTDPRTIAAYASGNTGGIRRFPYSTDPAVYPLTYGNLGVPQPVHNIGELWAVTLWDVYWNLVDAYGFDPDFYAGSGGNNLALRLVMDALKLQPCSPTFLDARDALLQADQMANQGVNKCRLWTAFAKHGIGIAANDGGSAASSAVTENFQLPNECAICGDVNDDEGVDIIDAAVAARALAGSSVTVLAPEKCNTTGALDLADIDANGLPDDCTPADVQTLREDLASLAPGIGSDCAPAVGVFAP